MARQLASLRRLLALGGVVVSMAAGPVAGSSTQAHIAGQLAPAHPQADAPPASGTELVHLNTDVSHYTQADNGNVHLRLYNSPVGSPSRAGWQFRDTRLGAAAAGKIAPALLPFGLQLTPTLTGSTLASFTSEDKVKFGIGLAAINGASPAAVTGQVGDEAITYTAPVASSSADLALRPTASGLDARLVLHKPDDGATFAFALALDQSTHLDQTADGTIRVVRPITQTTADGTQAVVSQAEYLMLRPIAHDSGTDPVAPVLTGPVSLTLGTSASGEQSLVVSIDPVWLRDPRRAFPVRVDLPIVTSTALAYTGQFGTVNSCSPDAPAPLTAVVVGTEGACKYNGQAYFATSAIMHDTPIVSATLKLYTPDTTGPTGVQLYPNVPISPTVGAPPRQPSWNSAPAVVTGSVGLTESATEGHWHNWDVTDLVRRWVGDSETNNGLTLVSSGSPVLFASSLDAGMSKPDQAPYLDITYAPRPAIAPQYMDPFVPSTSGIAPRLSQTASRSGRLSRASSPSQVVSHVGPRISDPYANNIYGVSGSFDTGCTALSCNGNVSPGTVYYNLGGRYMRFSVQLDCNANPSPSYWSTSGAAGTFNANTTGNVPDVPSLLRQAYQLNLIPIIDFLPPPPANSTNGSACFIFRSQYSSWGYEVQHFVSDELVKDYPPSANGTVYFEVGNEDNPGYSLYYPHTSIGYAASYGTIAAALNQLLPQKGYPHFRILTGGMLLPTASTDQLLCSDPNNPANNNTANYYDAQRAINNAINRGVYPSVLGAAVHPYHYNTDESNYWRNYYTEYGYYIGDGANVYNHYAGPCGDMNLMLSTWFTLPGNVPVIFTEVNWTSNADPSTANSGPNCSLDAGCDGTYLVDLFTWLRDHNDADPNNSPVRVMWYRGADRGSGHQLGIFTPNGAGKQIYLNACNQSTINNGQSSIDNDYYSLRTAACY